MSQSNSQNIAVAILDDYAELADVKFKALASKVRVSHFPDTINSRTTVGQDELAQILNPFQIISAMRERTPLPGDLLRRLPNLKLIMTTGAHNAAIDLTACKELGIVCTGTGAKSDSKPTGLFETTNEQTWALILGLTKFLPRLDGTTKTNSTIWQDGALVKKLAGKTLGILGLGRLGAQCAFTGKLGFGMEIICWSSNLTQAKADEVASARRLEPGSFKVVGSKKELFEQADILSVHYKLSDRSRGIVSSDELSVMKPTACLVNTSRGPLIDEEALLDAAKKGKIAGIGLDVFDIEPLPKDSPWRNDQWGKDGSSQVILSPHMGYVEEEKMNEWYDLHVEYTRKWLDGEELLNRLA